MINVDKITNAFVKKIFCKRYKHLLHLQFYEQRCVVT